MNTYAHDARMRLQSVVDEARRHDVESIELGQHIEDGFFHVNRAEFSGNMAHAVAAHARADAAENLMRAMRHRVADDPCAVAYAANLTMLACSLAEVSTRNERRGA